LPHTLRYFNVCNAPDSGQSARLPGQDAVAGRV
jgi:hypothetical protein